jgi:hypothetical protein
VRFYIIGVGRGYLWANIEIKRNGGKPMFCPPENLSINSENIISVLNQKIKDFEKNGIIKDDWDTEYILLLGLEETFPCK